MWDTIEAERKNIKLWERHGEVLSSKTERMQQKTIIIHNKKIKAALKASWTRPHLSQISPCGSIFFLKLAIATLTDKTEQTPQIIKIATKIDIIDNK